MTVIDLDQAELTWFPMVPAGADVATQMAPLWSDEERGLRTVLVDFPEGWRRDVTGNQPAQEEMVALSGSMQISGLRAGVGQLLVGAPHATRADTSSEGITRVLVWFSGEVGGWAEGPYDPPRAFEVVDLEPGEVRPPAAGLQGSVAVVEDVAGQTFDVDVDLLSVSARRWAHLPAGESAPELPGVVVVRRWS